METKMTTEQLHDALRNIQIRLLQAIHLAEELEANVDSESIKLNHLMYDIEAIIFNQLDEVKKEFNVPRIKVITQVDINNF